MTIPEYQCHKRVRAMRIKEIRPRRMPRFQHTTCRGSFAMGNACGNCERCDWERSNPVGFAAELIPCEPNCPTVHVGQGYLNKHNPAAGGFYLRYKDGYESFSPAQAFEEGYSLADQ